VSTEDQLLAFAELTRDAALFEDWALTTTDDMGLNESAPSDPPPDSIPPTCWPKVINADEFEVYLRDSGEESATPQDARSQWELAANRFFSPQTLLGMILDDPDADPREVFLRARMALWLKPVAEGHTPDAALLRIVAQIAAARWRFQNGDSEHPDVKRYEAHQTPLAQEAVRIGMSRLGGDDGSGSV
jgi:hypothetical protein